MEFIAEYTGPSRRGFNGYVIRKGQRVIVTRIAHPTGDVTVRYDPTDARHNDCVYGLNARISGFSMLDLTPTIPLTIIPKIGP